MRGRAGERHRCFRCSRRQHQDTTSGSIRHKNVMTKRDLLRSGALAAISVAATKPGPVQAQSSADRPGFFKAKNIAEAGYIYGLPIMMNYGVMYE